MVPFLFQGGLSTQLQMPLALTLSAGLLVSTLITVVVIPFIYSRWRGGRGSDERV
jgi:multidrug efflux pump subunit AcrB